MSSRSSSFEASPTLSSTGPRARKARRSFSASTTATCERRWRRAVRPTLHSFLPSARSPWEWTYWRIRLSYSAASASYTSGGPGSMPATAAWRAPVGLASTGDHSGDTGLVDDPAQRQLRRDPGRRGVSGHFACCGDADLVGTLKVSPTSNASPVPVAVAMIVGGEPGVLVVFPGQQSAGQRDSRDDSDALVPGGGGQHVLQWLRRKTLRMICTVATPARAIAVNA